MTYKILWKLAAVVSSITRSSWSTTACLPQLLSVVLLFMPLLRAEVVAVRFPEGSLRGFLVIRTSEGRTIASGDHSRLGDETVPSRLARERGVAPQRKRPE